MPGFGSGFTPFRGPQSLLPPMSGLGSGLDRFVNTPPGVGSPPGRRRPGLLESGIGGTISEGFDAAGGGDDVLARAQGMPGFERRGVTGSEPAQGGGGPGGITPPPDLMQRAQQLAGVTGSERTQPRGVPGALAGITGSERTQAQRGTTGTPQGTGGPGDPGAPPNPGDTARQRQGGWRDTLGWLFRGPRSPEGADLIGYEPKNNLQRVSDVLGQAAAGVMSQRGPYANPLGAGLLGASGALQGIREEDQRGAFASRQAVGDEQDRQLRQAALIAQLQRATGRAQGNKVVRPGEAIVDASGNVVFQAAPKAEGAKAPKNAQEAFIRSRIEGGADPAQAALEWDEREQRQALQRAAAGRSPGTTVVLPPAETEYQKGIGKAMAEQTAKVYNDRDAAAGRVQAIAQLQQLIPITPTGPLEDYKDQIRAVGEAFGVKSEGLAARQVMDSLTNKIVLDMSGGSLGAQISNSDRDFLRDLAPNKTRTPEANAIMAAAAGRAAQREAEAAEYKIAFVERTGSALKRDDRGRTLTQALKEDLPPINAFSDQDRAVLKAPAPSRAEQQAQGIAQQTMQAVQGMLGTGQAAAAPQQPQQAPQGPGPAGGDPLTDPRAAANAQFQASGLDPNSPEGQALIQQLAQRYGLVRGR